jgi:thermitase
MTDTTLRRRPARRPLAVLVTFAAVLLGPTAVTPAQAEEAGTTADSEDPLAGVWDVVVAVQQGADVASLAADFGLIVVDRLFGSSDTHLLRAPAGTDVLELAARLAADPRTRFAEPDFRVGSPEANPNYAWGRDSGPQPAGSDPSVWTGQEALTRLGVSAAHATSRGAGVTVAVVDTGVSAAHPSLQDRLAGPGVDVIDGDSSPDDVANGIDDDGDGRIDEAAGHGTHVAGIVAAVAPDARVLPVRVLDSDGVGSVFGVAEGLRTALAAGADVVNLSLGGTEVSEVLAEAIGDAGEDAVVVASAGNSGTTQRQYPAAAEGVLSVASVGASDARSVFSNHGWVDVAAPGESIVSTFPGGGYASWGGTSMAAPFVAGQAALLLPGGGEDATARAVQVIRNTAVPGDPQLGAGRVDVGASVVAASGGLQD